jgi:5'-nucleotidase
MRILITNDDGIHAHGIKVLEQIALQLSDDVTVVAPEMDQSGVAHSLSLNDPLRLREISPRHFAVKGTPTDCVIMGVHRIMADRKPDLVLSGVNVGHNMAEDVIYSGTVAGAMEGTILGITSIALSQGYAPGGKNAIDWSAAETHAPKVIRDILALDVPRDVLVNVNFPARPAAEIGGVSVTVQGRRDANLAGLEERFDGRGNPYYWIRYGRTRSMPPHGTDLEAIANGRISVTPLRIDLTDEPTLTRFALALR